MFICIKTKKLTVPIESRAGTNYIDIRERIYIRDKLIQYLQLKQVNPITYYLEVIHNNPWKSILPNMKSSIYPAAIYF